VERRDSFFGPLRQALTILNINALIILSYHTIWYSQRKHTRQRRKLWWYRARNFQVQK